MTTLDICYETIEGWVAAHPLGWECVQAKAGNVMLKLAEEILNGLGNDAEECVVQLSNDAEYGCYFLVTSPSGTRLVAHVLHDGTMDVRYYKFGEFQCRIVTWPNGHSITIMGEPIEVI